MSHFLGEFLGTAILIILGNGVVANVVLDKTKGHNSGWIVIVFGWAMAVFVGVFVASQYSYAHLNPAVTMGMALVGKMDWGLVQEYIGGQFAGAIAGAIIVWITYKDHFDETENADMKLAVFCTAPNIRKPLSNVITEMVGTFILVFGALHILPPASSMGGLDALSVALLVLAIGLSLGGPTGYAINPARDLGPRIVHFILPIKNKRDSNWSYSWVPVIGPVLGGILAALVFKRLS
jgi:glycerol uptake facilitator protein